MGEDPELCYMLRYLRVQRGRSGRTGSELLRELRSLVLHFVAKTRRRNHLTLFGTMAPSPEFLWLACLCNWKRQLHPLTGEKMPMMEWSFRCLRKQTVLKNRSDFQGELSVHIGLSVCVFVSCYLLQ